MGIKQRLNRVEQTVGVNNKAPMFLWQDFDDEELYRAESDQPYTESELRVLSEQFNLVKFVYVDDWRADGA